MNFEDLKDAWAGDMTDTPPLAVKDIPLKKVSSSVTHIRRNMRREFFWQLACYLVIIGIFLSVCKTALSFYVVSVTTFILLMQSGYYFFRVYIFYRATGRYDLTVIRSIRKIIYELELNIEVYKTCSYCAMPLAMVAGITILAGDRIFILMRVISSGYLVKVGTLPWVFLVLVISQVITIFFLNLHVRLQYGRYLAELKAVVYELDAEEL